MIVDARVVPNDSLIDCDVCIVGAGAAGITLAREFLGRRVQVVLLESGWLTPDAATQSLYTGEVTERRYFDLDFPDWGDEDDASDPTALIDEFEETFRRAVEIRLRADVPVVGYLSGGVDSAYVLATAAKVRGTPIPSFTIKVPHPELDEEANASITARAVGGAGLGEGGRKARHVHKPGTWRRGRHPALASFVSRRGIVRAADT